MKIENHFIDAMPIESFAEKYGLVMELHERERYVGHPERYKARFKNSETKHSIFLFSTYGNGATPWLAIKDYAEQISFKTLVIDAASPDRRAIAVPRLTKEPELLPPGVVHIPNP